MKVTIDRRRLAAVLRVLKCCVDEAKLVSRPDGVKTRVVDPAHVCMIELSVPREAFSAYSSLEEESIPLDLDKLSEVAAIGGSDTVSLETTDGKMVAVLGGTTRRMGLVDPAGIMEPKLPLTKLPESAEVALEDLQLAVRATVAISDHIAIRTEPPHLVFEGEGDTDTVTHRIPGVGSKMEVRSLFPLDYLSNFVSSLPAGSKLKLHLGQDYPIQVDFSWGDGAQTILGTYLLAPRIESE